LIRKTTSTGCTQNQSSLEIQVVEREDESVSAEARPIVADPCCDANECLWRRPTGSFFAPFDCELANDAAAIAYFQEIEDAAAARRRDSALRVCKEKDNERQSRKTQASCF
jgi:hypothetical protein